jgi:hypothetical protein
LLKEPPAIVELSCAAIEGLIGSNCSAAQRRIHRRNSGEARRVRTSGRGTLLLDEVGDRFEVNQGASGSKEQRFEPLGSTRRCKSM